MYEELVDRLQNEPLNTGVVQEVVAALRDMSVRMSVQEYYNNILRDGLEVYLPGPFWEDIVQHTKASEDMGKHAEWVLRLTEA